MSKRIEKCFDYLNKVILSVIFTVEKDQLLITYFFIE